MSTAQAPPGLSVPRPSIAATSYPLAGNSASALPGAATECGQTAHSWLTRDRLGDALVRAARRVGRPLDAGRLLLYTGIQRWIDPALADEVLGELVAAGRLTCEWDRPDLFTRSLV